MTPADQPAWVMAALAAAPVGRLATSAADGTVHLVPICFAVVDGHIAGAVDHKPKRRVHLQRLADIEATGRATFLVDHYDDDWTQLWWVRVTGSALVAPPGSALDALGRAALVDKYRQYQARPPLGPVYAIALDAVRGWRP